MASTSSGRWRRFELYSDCKVGLPPRWPFLCERGEALTGFIGLTLQRMARDESSHDVGIDLAPSVIEREGLGLGHSLGAIGEQSPDDPLACCLEIGRWDDLVYEPDAACFLCGEAFGCQRVAADLTRADGIRELRNDDGGRQTPAHLGDGKFSVF